MVRMLVLPQSSPAPEIGEPSFASRPSAAIFSSADMSVRVTMSQGWHMTLAADFPSADSWRAARLQGGHGAAAQAVAAAGGLVCIYSSTIFNQRKVSTVVMGLWEALCDALTLVCTYL